MEEVRNNSKITEGRKLVHKNQKNTALKEGQFLKESLLMKIFMDEF